jgi:hypothetical protein
MTRPRPIVLIPGFKTARNPELLLLGHGGFSAGFRAREPVRWPA